MTQPERKRKTGAKEGRGSSSAERGGRGQGGLRRLGGKAAASRGGRERREAVMADASTILVIDDEEDFCEFVKESLERDGKFIVLTSSDSASGVTIAEEYQPDLVLLDIKMPHMSGAEVAEHLLKSESTRDIPIAFITGLLDKKVVRGRNGYIHGFPFITKPVTSSELLSQVEAALEVARHQKAFIESLEKA